LGTSAIQAEKHDHSIKIQDLLREAEQLTAERNYARTQNLSHPFVVLIK
jgi:hypothetical protein